MQFNGQASVEIFRSTQPGRILGRLPCGEAEDLSICGSFLRIRETVAVGIRVLIYIYIDRYRYIHTRETAQWSDTTNNNQYWNKKGKRRNKYKDDRKCEI